MKQIHMCTSRNINSREEVTHLDVWWRNTSPDSLCSTLILPLLTQITLYSFKYKSYETACVSEPQHMRKWFLREYLVDYNTSTLQKVLL